jgi:hypothetical protein
MKKLVLTIWDDGGCGLWLAVDDEERPIAKGDWSEDGREVIRACSDGARAGDRELCKAVVEAVQSMQRRR